MSGVLVGVKTADCVPVLLADTKYQGVRCGPRRLARNGAVDRAESLRNYAGGIWHIGKRFDLRIGPAAGCGNYEIGRDVIEAFAENFTESEKYFTSTIDGHALVDLHLANEDQLTSLGVPAANIYKAPFCTIERTDLFFSYRVEKKLYGKTGRLMSVIGRGQL